MAAPLQRTGEYDIFLKDSGDELMPTISAFLSPVEPAGQDINLASHAPLPWRGGELKADAGSKGSHVVTDAARKPYWLSMQPPPQSGVLRSSDHLAPHSIT